MTDAANIAYEAYNKAVYPGQPCVKFQHLTDKEQQGWANAAHAAGPHVMQGLDDIKLQQQADNAYDEYLADEAQSNSTQL